MIDENPNESLIDLAAVVERVRPQLRRTLEAYRIPVADSEDLVREALLAMLAERDEIGDPGPCLVAALRHRCRLYVLRHQTPSASPAARSRPPKLSGTGRGS
jgi:DNA-directed RNA polymerase specialized sigma24 family protein